MKKKPLFLVKLCIIGCLFAGCNQGFEQADSGLLFRFIEQGQGPKPQKGEFLILDLLIKTENDSIIFSTVQNGVYFPVRYDPYKQKVGLDNILEEGFYMLAVGDSAVFKLRAGELYRSVFKTFAPMGPEEAIIAETRVIDIYTYEGYRRWKRKELTKRRHRHNLERDKILRAQIAEIETHLQSQKVEYSETDSGIRYTIFNPGWGSYPKEGDSVSFSYTVTYFDGSKIEGGIGSSAGKPKSIMMGAAGVFESWQESIKLLKQGGKGRFYFPSPLAFGASGGYGIKPNSILVVDMELVNIKNNVPK